MTKLIMRLIKRGQARFANDFPYTEQHVYGMEDSAIGKGICANEVFSPHHTPTCHPRLSAQREGKGTQVVRLA
jgi:hypothetical protein